ncbi:MAG: tRNA modification GTPase [Bacteroidia bacterium]|jgi:tRNA modification GTPase
MLNLQDTIVAPATPAGVSAISIVRLSGNDAISIVDACFTKPLKDQPGYTIHYGFIKDGDADVDEVLVSLFRNPQSYTGEDSIEISCHGSPFIVRRVIETMINNGARMADPGEFTLRAFLNQKLDLAQAEAVADMIHSNSEASLQMAISQIRGGFSEDISYLRQELIDFAALIELENDFGEEDVEFANRPKLRALVEKIITHIEKLRTSFVAGNAMKNGVNTVIAGKPNAGKSTLLNALLNEDRAIVSEIEGTTRDTIEEMFVLKGVQFRLIDTAGLRESTDHIEQIGVGKAKAEMDKAELLMYLFDVTKTTPESLHDELTELPKVDTVVLVANKIDAIDFKEKDWPSNTVAISAKHKNIDTLLKRLEDIVDTYEFGNETIVNNARHADALAKSSDALQTVLEGLSNDIPSDLVALDIRDGLYYLGLITGEVTNDEVLSSIFGRFCIGK